MIDLIKVVVGFCMFIGIGIPTVVLYKIIYTILHVGYKITNIEYTY